MQLFRIRESKYNYIYFLAIGFIVRLVFAPFTRDPWDMDIWINIGNAVLSGQNPYALPSNALVYPPLWAIFCAAGNFLYNLTRNVFVQYFTIKLPIIIADIVISVVIRHIVYNLTSNEKKAQIAMVLYLFNPVTIIISSLWGMFDAIPTLLALLSFLFLLKGKYGKSSLVLGLGIGFKGFFPALLLPLFLYYTWKKGKKMYISIQYFFYSLLIPFLISIPFLITDSGAYISSILFHVGRLPKNLTYWFGIGKLLEIGQIPTTTISSISAFFSITSFLALYILLIKKANSHSISNSNQSSTEFVLKGVNSVLLIFFVTSSIINEQYLVWILPFLIIYFMCFKSSLRPIFYALAGFDMIFIILNVGPRFFSPIIEVPTFWNEFQYSSPSMILLVLTGSLFSVVCICGLVRLIRNHICVHRTCARPR